MDDTLTVTDGDLTIARASVRSHSDDAKNPDSDDDESFDDQPVSMLALAGPHLPNPSATGYEIKLQARTCRSSNLASCIGHSFDHSASFGLRIVLFAVAGARKTYQ